MSENLYDVPVFSRPIEQVVRPPGSKSETIRALAMAGLAEGRSHLYSPLRAADTAAMVTALGDLGIDVSTDAEPWTVDGRGGHLGDPSGPIDANESGLSARILLAMAASRDGMTTVTGQGRLPERPMTGLLDALRSQGVEVTAEHLPISVTGRGRLWGGPIAVDCAHSSQFATAVMVVAPLMREPCILELMGLTGSGGYLDVTAATMRKFGADLQRTVTGYEIAVEGYKPADVVIEPDASAAAYPMGLAAITGGRVVIEGLDRSSRQPDVAVARVLAAMGCDVAWDEGRITVAGPDNTLIGVDVDMSDAPDGALAIAVVSLFAGISSRISGLASLRHKESDRLDAMTEEIAKLGGRATVDGDALLIEPTPLHGGVVDPHGDHRIAMAIAMVGSVVDGVQVSTPQVVDKTWPGYWEFLDLAAAKSAQPGRGS